MSHHRKTTAQRHAASGTRRTAAIVLAGLACIGVTLQAHAESGRLVFTTSVTGNGDLSSWPDAAGGNLAGLQAGDAICRSRATAAGLPEPQAFVAWLSDQDTDAYCHLLGFAGKRSDNCGGVQPPMQAGPWVRTDGAPFAETFAALLEGEVLSPLLTNEFGQRIPSLHHTFTATAADGTLQTWTGDSTHCNGWTTATQGNNVLAAQGSAAGTTVQWTDAGGGTSCDALARLMCIQQGTAPALPARPTQGKPLAFVTAANVGGNLGGVAGADALCNTAASEASLPDAGLFKALVTSSQSGSIADRFKSDGPWYRVDGMLFAAAMPELLAATTATSLNVTEYGEYVGYAVALTGAQMDGAPSGLNCALWTSGSGVAEGSLVNQTFFENNSHNWLSPAQVSCSPALQPNDWPKKLYCLSDPGLFRDEFE